MQKAKRWFLLGVLCYLTILTFGQQEAALEAVFNAGDIKKLTKAEEYKANADKLVEEAARLNMEELTVGSDATLNEKSRQRKVEQLQNQALQKYLEAATWLKKCNEVKFTVYRDYLNRFWDEHDGEEEAYLNEKLMEEQASDHFFQALNYRLEAKKMDAGYARVEKLNEANALEEQALRKQVDALLNYYITVEGEHPTDTITEQTVWVREDTIGSTSDDLDYTADSVYFEEPEADILFRIKIAETVEPLTMGQLKSIIPFGYAVEELLEDNRYVYLLLGVRTYAMVEQIADELGLEDSEVEIYSNGQKVKTGDTLMHETSSYGDPYIGKDELLNDILYSVQIAASRVPLSPDELDSIYKGDEQVSMIIEDSWYKYQLQAGKSHERAEEIRLSCGVDQAFIVAYIRAKKTNYFQILKRLR